MRSMSLAALLVASAPTHSAPQQPALATTPSPFTFEEVMVPMRGGSR